VAVVYRCDSDGTDIRPLSTNAEHDNTPWVLPDGRVLFTRWEYVDRSQFDYHHLDTDLLPKLLVDPPPGADFGRP
jgi:hypothetical protein